MKLNITSLVQTDEIIYQLQNTLSTKQLIEFVLQLGDNLTEQEEFLLGLKNKLDAFVQ